MKRLGQSSLATGTGTLLYTVPTGYKTQVQDICISNTASSIALVKIHLVSAGGAVSISNELIPNVAIAGNSIIQWTGNQSMLTGDFIQGIGSVVGVTVHINGEEIRANV